MCPASPELSPDEAALWELKSWNHPPLFHYASFSSSATNFVLWLLKKGVLSFTGKKGPSKKRQIALF